MQFSKMHTLGSDFVVVDAVTQNVFFSPDIIKRLANRNVGIGFENLLVVEPPYDPDLDFHCRIYNAQGNEIAQIGNGIRCFALFVRFKGLTGKRTIKVGTLSGKITVNVDHEDQVTVNMGIPDFEPATIPFKAPRMEKTYILRQAERTILASVVAVGGPYCIVQVNDIQTVDVDVLGALFEKHERFPEKASIGFMQIVNREHIKLRVFERGIGETPTSNNGAGAAVAVGILQNLLDENVRVEQADGSLTINWKREGQPLLLTGSAIHVFDGLI